MRFLDALSFLTVLPVPGRRGVERDFSCCMTWFPVVGLLLGGILVGADRLLSPLFHGPALTALLVLLLAFLTGALHLDGLADTTDAIGSRKGREEKLRIMKESGIGAMGAAALIFCILLKVLFLAGLSPEVRLKALLLVPTAGRWGILPAAFLHPYARPEGGTGKAFVEGMGLGAFLRGSGIAILLFLVLFRLAGLFLFGSVLGFVLCLSIFISRKIGGMTGDTLGAVEELTEVFVLGVLCTL